MAIAPLLHPAKILLRFGGWPFVGWKRPRNGTTVRPRGVPCRLDYDLRRQGRASGRDAAANSGRRAFTSLLLERSIKELSLMATLSLARKGAIILGATLALATLTQSAEARWYGCWGCGAFAAGAIAGAAIAAPYAPPVYYAPRPVVVAPPVAPVVVAPAPVVTPVYPVCPALPPYPYYCR